MSKRIKTALKKPLKCQTLVLKQHVLLFMFYAYPPKQKNPDIFSNDYETMQTILVFCLIHKLKSALICTRLHTIYIYVHI